MRKIYLVKKNPELPADGNNWLVMNSFEFMNFIQTPEGQKRRDRFGQLDACSVDDQDGRSGQRIKSYVLF